MTGELSAEQQAIVDFAFVELTGTKCKSRIVKVFNPLFKQVFERKKLGTEHVVLNYCRTQIPNFHILLLLFNFAQVF